MLKKGRLGFAKGEEIRLPCGAVIIPIFRNRQGEVNTEMLIDYLLGARNTKCLLKEGCIDVLLSQEYCVGFSCEKCPHNQTR